MVSGLRPWSRRVTKNQHQHQPKIRQPTLMSVESSLPRSPIHPPIARGASSAPTLTSAPPPPPFPSIASARHGRRHRRCLRQDPLQPEAHGRAARCAHGAALAPHHGGRRGASARVLFFAPVTRGYYTGRVLAPRLRPAEAERTGVTPEARRRLRAGGLPCVHDGERGVRAHAPKRP